MFYHKPNHHMWSKAGFPLVQFYEMARYQRQGTSVLGEQIRINWFNSMPVEEWLDTVNIAVNK